MKFLRRKKSIFSLFALSVLFEYVLLEQKLWRLKYIFIRNNTSTVEDFDQRSYWELKKLLQFCINIDSDVGAYTIISARNFELILSWPKVPTLHSILIAKNLEQAS